MLKQIFEKIAKGETLAREERQYFLDWAERAENVAGPVNPMTGQTTVNISGPSQNEINAMVEQAITANARAYFPRLSDISNQLGLQIAGEFRTGNGLAPGDGFTGGRFGYPGFTYGGTTYFLAGVSSDVLQVGLSLADGKVYAGGGDVTMDGEGVWIENQQAAFGFEDTGGNRFNIYLSSNATDDLTLVNQVGGKLILLRADTAAHDVLDLMWGEHPTLTNSSRLLLEAGSAGGRAEFGSDHFIDFLKPDGTGSATVYFNERGKDIDVLIKDGADVTLLKTDAGLSGVGIGGDPVSTHKLKVHGNLNITSGSTYDVAGVPVIDGNTRGIKPESNAADIFSVTSPGGPSLWTGTISGAPSGTSVTVSAPITGTEAVLVPTNTNQLAKMRLYNTTRSNSALISNYNTGTNVVSLVSTVPANWANGDSLTVASQTVSGGGLNWVDLEITSSLTGRSAFLFKAIYNGAAVGDSMRLHPLSTFSASKYEGQILTQNAGTNNTGYGLMELTSNVFSLTWSGSSSSLAIRESGYAL